MQLLQRRPSRGRQQLVRGCRVKQPGARQAQDLDRGALPRQPLRSRLKRRSVDLRRCIRGPAEQVLMAAVNIQRQPAAQDAAAVDDVSNPAADQAACASALGERAGRWWLGKSSTLQIQRSWSQRLQRGGPASHAGDACPDLRHRRSSSHASFSTRSNSSSGSVTRLHGILSSPAEMSQLDSKSELYRCLDVLIPLWQTARVRGWMRSHQNVAMAPGRRLCRHLTIVATFAQTELLPALPAHMFCACS